MIEPIILAAIEARLTQARSLPPIGYRPFVAVGVAIGVVDDERAERLRAYDALTVGRDRVVLDPKLRDAAARSAVLADIAASLRGAGLLPAWRDERFAIAPGHGEAPLFAIERGAARYFGLPTHAVHVNGIVPARGGGEAPARMWLARRSAAKAVDPGMLDNLVGGGIAAGYRIDETLVKEAFEEAGVPEALARQARAAGTVHSVRPMFDGLQRETLFVHDLVLPRDFTPQNQDGEATEHRLVAIPEAARIIGVTGGCDEATIDASLVVLDYLVRHGHVPADHPAYCRLEALLHGGLETPVRQWRRAAPSH